MPEFTDTYRDLVTVEHSDENVWISIEEYDGHVVTSAGALLDPETAAKVAAAIAPQPETTPANLFGASDADERTNWNRVALSIAIEHGRTAEFGYSKAVTTAIERRLLKPEYVNEAKDGSVLVVGYDPLRDDYRAYRLDRIVGYVEVR